MTKVILPGATIGVFGSGQLGRMFALAARAMGYRVHTYSPDHDSPAGQVSDVEVTAPYDDLDAVRSFARSVDVVTFEFENVSSVVADVCSGLGVPVRPSAKVLSVAQQRLREKGFLSQSGLPVPDFLPVRSLQDLHFGVDKIGLPAILKTAAFGYDGKGQVQIRTPDEVLPAWDAVRRHDAVLESVVQFDHEVSIVCARGIDGAFAHYGVIENIHHHHILDISIAPARVAAHIRTDAVELARLVMNKLSVTGVLCVEFFVTKTGTLLINELAPRPHNSGHLTVDNAITSQFEQQLRTVCGLPLGATDMHSPAAMVNLLGDLWQAGEPDWQAALADPGVKLHLYGKRDARPGRKMGHLTVLADDVEKALHRAKAARAALSSVHRLGPAQ